ncbi:MAG: Hsp20/alpha crystallin family protein [Coriobacteriia bacterium]|nr:Hsp20/alpha crystallin family protein [Anaerosomatales bacterium]
MAIMRWDPFGEVLSMQRELDRLVRRFGVGGGSDSPSSAAPWMPRIDVRTEGDDMVVYAELPGLEREDIDVSVTDGVLTIKGERKAESEQKGQGWLIRERSYGAFERSLALPESVDADAIQADYHDGVLEVHVPKAAEALKPKTHRIALGAGGKK